jgi:hypothetical protein
MKSKTKYVRTIFQFRTTVEFTRLCSELSAEVFPKKTGEKAPEKSAARFIKGVVCEYLYRRGLKKEYVESIV